MSKRNKIIYWIATVWLSLGMASSGLVQILGVKEEVDLFNDLGYPLYFMSFLGVVKILGVITVLIPRFPLLKEWAYAGFFFSMVGALYSHIAAGNSAAEIFPPVLLLTLTMLSWYFRPIGRKIVAVNQ